MKLITIEELKKLPKGSLFCFAEKVTDTYYNPEYPLLQFDSWYEDNPYFGYAREFIPGHHGFMGNDIIALSGFPSRFYVNKGVEYTGEERFFLYEKKDIEIMKELLNDSN